MSRFAGCLSHALRTASVVAIAFSALRAAPLPDEPPVGWWRDATFYEIFVRSFADATSGPLAGDGIGDLQGLIEHLDYLNDGRAPGGNSLGVTALWLMPIQPSPSYHGYDVSDYFAVNPQYGDVALMKRLVQECHRRGIRVIVDLVLNHCSSEHPQFKLAASGNGGAAAAARQLFRFADLPEQLAGPWSQRVWHPAGDRFYYGVFGADMPDWDLRNADATAHHYRTAAFWLRDIGVDGFRLDAVRYLVETGDALQDTAETLRWLRDFTAYCHRLKPGAFVISENTADMREVSRGILGGSEDSAFEFDLERATLEAIRLGTPGILNEALRWLGNLYGAQSPWATLISNHDQERPVSQLDNDPAKARLAAKLLFTLPGVPFMYYGDELGLKGRKPDPELRTPMPWTSDLPNAGFTAPAAKPWHAITADVRTQSVAVARTEPRSLLALYRQLIRLNASSPALRHGAPLPIAAEPRRAAYVALRQTDSEVVLVLGNVSKQPIATPKLSVASSALRPGWRLTEELAGVRPQPAEISATGGFSGWAPLPELAPESVYVMRWRP